MVTSLLEKHFTIDEDTKTKYFAREQEEIRSLISLSLYKLKI